MIQKKRTEEWESRLGTSNFNPLEVIELQDAIKKHKIIVSIQNREFSLRYYLSPKTKEEMVFYKLSDNFVPCGHLSINRFLRGI